MNDRSLSVLNDCGCCQGLTARTPARLYNRPGLSQIAYRVGTHGQFLQTMLARLSASEFPALAKLKTRDEDDFSVALLDAWATVADVLTFYQERIANESYLRTARERLSLLQLARLIGYELRPGVAAGTYLAFTLEEAPGVPEQAVRKTIIDVGTKVQSVPGPGEQPQTFETIEKIEARVEWNALMPQLTERQTLAKGTKQLFLKGLGTQLQTGDAVVLVDREKAASPASKRWAFGVVENVLPVADQKQPERSFTVIILDRPLPDLLPSGQPADEFVAVFALRQRAALFGHNAPDPNLFSTKDTNLDALLEPPPPFFLMTPQEFPLGIQPPNLRQWRNFRLQGNRIDLDSSYPKIVPGSWLVLSSPTAQELYKAKSVSHLSRSSFGLSGKITRIEPDGQVDPDKFGLRETAVFAQSEALALAEKPIQAPVYGGAVTLSTLAPDLTPGQALAVSGKRLRIRIAASGESLELVNAAGEKLSEVKPGDVFTVLAPPVKLVRIPLLFFPLFGLASLPAMTLPVVLSPEGLIAALEAETASRIRWEVAYGEGLSAYLTAPSKDVVLLPANQDDETVREIAFIAQTPDAVVSDSYRTTVKLKSPLKNVYVRDTLALNANVARATHGETVAEILGSGDASLAYPRFTLSQSPLTYVSAATSSGAESTLQVRVNDLLWREVPTLFGHTANDHIYITRRDDEGKVAVQFGDGRSGARLPSGQDNVRASYRKGIGRQGNVRAGQLTTLLTRPLGVKEAVNPEAASGGDDPEAREDARRNAPLSVLTLDRAVSLRDYEDFARTFAGVAKALATWSWDGGARKVLLTIAGPEGAEIAENSDTFKNLLAALKQAGDPNVRIEMKSYRKATFQLAGSIKPVPEFLPEKVLAAVGQALRAQFSFEARSFGQPVSLSEVVATIQAVPGVAAVDVDKLYRVGESAVWNARLLAAMPEVGADGEAVAAELLTLDPAPIELRVMP